MEKPKNLYAPPYMHHPWPSTNAGTARRKGSKGRKIGTTVIAKSITYILNIK